MNTEFFDRHLPGQSAKSQVLGKAPAGEVTQ